MNKRIPVSRIQFHPDVAVFIRARRKLKMPVHFCPVDGAGNPRFSRTFVAISKDCLDIFVSILRQWIKQNKLDFVHLLLKESKKALEV
jgi:hypothetical protein